MQSRNRNKTTKEAQIASHIVKTDFPHCRNFTAMGMGKNAAVQNCDGFIASALRFRSSNRLFDIVDFGWRSNFSILLHFLICLELKDDLLDAAQTNLHDRSVSVNQDC